MNGNGHIPNGNGHIPNGNAHLHHKTQEVPMESPPRKSPRILIEKFFTSYLKFDLVLRSRPLIEYLISNPKFDLKLKIRHLILEFDLKLKK